VGSEAIVRAPNGATLLAAGQKVALTGRGLEGIQLELRAPEDQAVNLGTLQGDAVGIFAGQLKHSGAIQATGVSVEGGKVVLKATDSADIAGTVTATRGAVGGQVHATANKVMLRSGAVVDLSGQAGGGEALIGGGWQGQDSRIANAKETTIEAGATLRADAIEQGNGGTIVAWSDGATRAYGSFSARGGASQGDGGKVETSGHYLDMQGQVDTRAPNGRTGDLLLDPTNVYIASSLINAIAAGMSGTDISSSGPGFTPSGTVQDSLVTVSAIESYLSSTNVTVRTNNASGTGAGDIIVVDPINWTPLTTPTELGLWADRHITINAPISSSTGALVMRTDGGNISQSAAGAIGTSSLVAYAQGGSVSLANASNSVSSLAGYAGTAGGFSFKNSGSASVDSITSDNAFGTFNGIRSVGPVSIDVGGDLMINDTAYGIDAGSNAVSLIASGTLGQGFGGALTAGSLNVAAADISLTGNNKVSSFSASAGTGSINLDNTTAGNLTLGNISSPGSVDVSENTGNIVINGDIASSWGIGLRAEAAGSSITRVAGTLITSNASSSISLAAGSGGIGSATAPILTSGTSTSFSAKGGSFGSGPGGVFISHTGDASLPTVNLAPDAPLSFSASGDLLICCSTISTGTNAMALTAGDKMTFGTDGGATLSGGSVKLVANEMAFGIGTSVSASTLIEVLPNDNRAIKLGLTQVDGDGVMELDFDTMNSFHVASGVLRIGSTTAGPLTINSSIAPDAGTLSLLSGSTISQDAGATLAVPKLAVKALGDVTLTESGNSVGEVAANVGDAVNQNHNFLLRTGSPLTVGSADGLSGISINIGGGYNAFAPDGWIMVASGGFLNQAAGALLKGKAVYAEGSSVILTEANPTGVIAGKATGFSADTFQYTSSNGIALDTVNGFSGVQHAGGLASNAIQLTGTSVSQQAGAAVMSGGGLQVTATAGGVSLLDGANDVAQLSGAAVGSIDVRNSASLTVQSLSSSAGPINVASGGALQVSGPVTTTDKAITLGSQSTAFDAVTVDGTVDAGVGPVTIFAVSGDLLFGSSASVAGGSVRLQANDMSVAGSITASSLIEVVNQTAGRPIELGSTSTSGTHLQLDSAELASFSGPLLRIGSISSGDILVGGSFATPGVGVLSLQSGGAIQQTAGGITAPKLALKAGGEVSLTGANMVGEVAASVMGTNANFSLTSGQDLNVGVGLDGSSGVTLSGDMTGYDPLTPNTVIALKSSGSLTQSAGALLAGKAVYVEGASVVLTDLNPTGMIAGQATGGATGVFHYSSTNGIALSTVDGFSGVQNLAGTGADAIALKGWNVGLAPGASLVTAGGVQATAISGDVYLSDAGNSVSAFSATGFGNINFYNSGDLTLGSLSSSTGAISINSGGALTLTGTVTAPVGVMLSGNSGVTQNSGAAIVSAGGLHATGGSGSVTLADAGNDVAAFKASAVGNITYNDASAVMLGTLSSGSGSVTVSAGGALDLTGTVWAPAGASLSGTSIYQSGGSIVAGSGGLLANATGGSIELAGAGNSVGSFSGAALGGIHFHDVGALSLGSLSSSSGWISIDSGGALMATGSISAPGGVDLNATSISQTAGASIVSAGGLTVSASTGSVMLGDTGNNVASFAGMAAGDISFYNAGSLTLDGIASSSGSITVASGGALSLNLGLSAIAGVSLSGTSIGQVGGASIVSGGGLTATSSVGDVMLTDSGNDVASVSITSAGSIGIYNMGDLSLGSLSSGSGSIAAGTGGVLTVSQSINAGSLALSGASVTQAGGASITSGMLAVAATSGGISLTDSGNSVATFGATAPGDISFFSASSLSLGSISSSGGSVSIGSAGSVGQATGASIIAGGGLQVNAGAGGISLLEGGNAVSWFTASAPGDIRFANASSLSVKSLSSGGFISVAAGGALTALQSISASSGVALAGQSVSQTSGASIVTGGPLKASASAGDIMLGDSGNSVGGFTASASGSILFYNASDLTLGGLSAGAGSIAVSSGGALSASQAITAANGITLDSSGTLGQALTVGASLDAGSGGVSLLSASGDVLFSGSVGIAGAGDAWFIAPAGNVRVTSGVTMLASNVGSSDFLRVDGGTLKALNNVTIPNLLLANGTLEGADVTIGSQFDWTGGAMTGSGKTIIASSATADISGPVTAARPMVNDGSVFLWGSGNITVGSGFSLVNNGLFEIGNDGGFTGGVGSIQNSGTFRKGSTAVATTTTTSPSAFTFASSTSSTSGASMVDVASFSNTGTLDVQAGTLQFAPLAFGANAGLIWLESGATLDNSNTTLASTGWIKGSGTLALGTGALDNSGELAPGGLGGIGMLAIQAATVNLQAGSNLLMDVADTLNYDRLQVSGNVHLASGASITPNTGSAMPAAGDSFDFIASSGGTVGGVLPTVSGFDTAFVAAPASLRLSVPLPPPPPPAPAPAPAPAPTSALVERILEIVPDASPSLVSAMLSEQDSTLTTFTTLLLEEEEAQAKDAVVNEVSGAQICKP
jgi:hypothetical protein